MRPLATRVLGFLAGAILLGGAVALLRGAAPGPARGGGERALWFYQALSLTDDAAYARVAPLWRRAAAAGYSAVVLADARFARLPAQGPAYFARAAELRALAAALHLEIVPGVALVGRGNGALLAMDPNLAEALPVREALFEVRGGIAMPVADPPVTLAPRPDRADAGIALTDTSARIPGGNEGRVTWTIAVAPWRLYHVSVRLRGEDFHGEPRLRVTGDGRELAFANVAPPRSGEPEVRDVMFDSQDCRSVTVGLSLSRRSAGALTWSGWRIEEAGPVNAIRRGPMRFRFEGLEEGRDFDAVTDPGLGTHGGAGAFDTWHVPPVIRVRRPDGTRLRASWWSAAVILHNQASVCLSDTAALSLTRDEIVRARELFGARTMFLMHDEIRIMAQDSTCRATGLTPGRILAAHVRACTQAAAPARVVVWNDMFDPAHNAVKDYYLVRGDLAGSWEGLAPAVEVANWNSEHTEASLKFFADRGHAQVWAGYYDTPPGAIRDVLPLLDRTPNVEAIMYTTWQDRYDDLEAFAKACRGR